MGQFMIFWNNKSPDVSFREFNVIVFTRVWIFCEYKEIKETFIKLISNLFSISAGNVVAEIHHSPAS